MDHVSLALWATNLEIGSPNLASWLARVDQRMAEVAASGAQLLVLPEFACASWLNFAPVDLPATAQLGWLAEVGSTALPDLAAMASRHGVSLLPGTIPHAMDAPEAQPSYANRAWLLTPDGSAFHQDKLSLTPLEEHSTAGVTRRGDTVQIIPWMGLRVAIIICLDVEYTALWAQLGALDLDLVLVPAKTDMISGYHRVFGCARARAIELQTAVCTVGAVGEPLGYPVTDTGVGGAAAYLPCDISTSANGLAAAMAPHAATSGLEPVLWVRDLPVGQCRRIRHGAAEAEICPASWPAGHLKINDSSQTLTSTAARAPSLG